MALLGKIGQALGQIGRFYTSPEGLQNLQATFQDMANPGGGAFAALQAQRQRDAQQRQMVDAYGKLIGQIQPPDTMTPQLNELIGGANTRMAGMGQAPLDQMTPRPAGLDMQNPQTREALMSFISAGGNPDAAFGLAERIAPPTPNMSLFNTRSGVVGIRPDTGETRELYSDPYAEALADRQIEAQSALAEQRRAQGRASVIRANRPPVVRAGGGGVPSSGGPVATGRRF